MNIREEQEHDFEQVFSLNALAFGNEGEAKLVNKLRSIRGYISLVAEENGKVIGHISFSPVTLNGEMTRFTGLAPMSVLPEYQKQGIGKQLIKAGLAECRNAGHTAVVVLGHVDYYPKFGFVTAATGGLKCVYDVPDEAFMALELIGGSLEGKSGIIEYDPAFAEI